MTDLSSKVIAVIDHGSFIHVAERLAKDFGQVYYTTQMDKGEPTVKDIFGDGVDSVEWVEDFWHIKKRCDVVCFPDIGFSGMQEELRSQGMPVFGSGDADELEAMRGLFLETVEKLGLPVPQYTAVQGLTALRKHLRNKTDKWCKVSKYRGDIETFHWRDWTHDEVTLDCLAFKLGPMKEMIKFYVIDPIQTIIEDGVDQLCIDGKLATICLHAMEAKDKSLLGTVVEFKDIDERVRYISEEFATVLAKHDYRNFFSTEVRLTDDESYFIDPTLRCGSPPSQVQMELYANVGEIVWAGAHGECVDPVPTAEFGAQILIKSKDDPDQWTTADIADDLKQWVKAGTSSVLDGTICSPPDGRSKDFGWLCAIGDSIQEVINTLKERAKELPEGFEADTDSLAELLVEINSAEDQGMEFTDQEIPEPASVIANGE